MPAVAPARPKSVIFARPRPSIITLAGLRSRCSTPSSCAAARPAQSCRAISTALSSGSRPMRRSSDARSSPSTYSIERKCAAVDLSPMSKTRQTFGCVTRSDEADFVEEALEPIADRARRRAAGTSARRAGRASGHRRDRPRPCRRGRAGRPCDSGRRPPCRAGNARYHANGGVAGTRLPRRAEQDWCASANRASGAEIRNSHRIAERTKCPCRTPGIGSSNGARIIAVDQSGRPPPDSV